MATPELKLHICLCNCSAGRWIGIEKDYDKFGIPKEGCVHIAYIPAMSFRKAVIRNVLEISIPPVLYSHNPDIPGVRKDGYIILSKGSLGQSDLFEQLNLFLQNRDKDLQQKLMNLQISEQLARTDLRKKSDEDKERFRDYMEKKKLLERRPRPGGGRGMPPEEEEEM